MAPRGGIPYGRTALERQAELELTGVGAPERGEWREWSGYAFHLRRRLTDAEELITGQVRDVRGTPEAERRYQRLPRRLHNMLPAEILAEELGR